LHQLKFFQIAFTAIPEELDVARVILDKHMALFQDGLNEQHFDCVAGHFIATLQKFNVGPDLIEEAVGVIAPLRGIFLQASKDYGPPEAAELSDYDDEVSSCMESQDRSLAPPLTLTEKLGGLDTLEAVIDAMYRRVAADRFIKSFFKGVDLDMLKIHQLLFLSQALDNTRQEVSAAGADAVGLADRFDIVVGRHLQMLFQEGLNEKHFDRLVEHLVFTLKTFKIARPVIDEVVKVMSPVRQVFARGAWQSERLKI
jgi:hemoglobin